MANSNNVRVGKPEVASGGMYAAALTGTGTTAPTDASTALGAGFAAMGYAGEDGLKQTIDTDTTDVKAWGGDTVRTVKTSHKVTYKVTLIEWSLAVLQEVFGAANVTQPSAGKIKVALNSADNPIRQYAFQMLDAGNSIRVHAPRAQVTSVDDVDFTEGDAAGFPIEITCYPDSNGNKAYLYLDAAA